MMPRAWNAAELEFFDTVATLQTTRPLTDHELTGLKQLIVEYMKFNKLQQPGCVVVNPSRRQDQEKHRLSYTILSLIRDIGLDEFVKQCRHQQELAAGLLHEAAAAHLVLVEHKAEALR